MVTVRIRISTSHVKVALGTRTRQKNSVAEIIVGMQRRIRDFDERLLHKRLVFIGGEYQNLREQGEASHPINRLLVPGKYQER